MSLEGQKELVTEGSVRSMAPGSELVLGAGRIATPAALDLAFQRGIRVRWSDERAPTVAPKPGTESALWSRMKAQDATYVVVVRGGRAVVTRLGERGPEPYGEE